MEKQEYTKGVGLHPNEFVLSEEECVRKSVNVPQESGVQIGERLIAPAGTVVPSNDMNAIGVLYEDVDVTLGDQSGSAVTGGGGILMKYIDVSAEAEEALRNAGVNLIGPKTYGVRFDDGANAGDTVHRTYGAEGMVAGVGTETENPQNDFDSIYPWSARRRCCGSWDENGNFVVNAYKGEDGYAEDGSKGEVWVEHSLFYYRHVYDGDAEEIAIADGERGGFYPAPIFVDRDGKVHDKAYTAAYQMADVDGKPTSRSGVFPGVYSHQESITAARTLGDRFTVMQIGEWYTEALYMWVEFATRNIQSVMMGAGSLRDSSADKAVVAEESANRIIVPTAAAAHFIVGQTIGIGVKLNATDIGNRIITSIDEYDEENKAISFDGDPVSIAVGNIVFSLPWKNGSCDGVIASSGSNVSNTDGLHNCIYRGKESPFGNIFEWISDILFKREGTNAEDDPYSYVPHFLPDVTKYTGELTEDYVRLAYNIPTADGNVKKLGLDSRFPYVRIPGEVGAGTATYYSDYYFHPRLELCVARVGGSFGNTTKCGMEYWYCENTPANKDLGCGARLSYAR